MDVISLRSIKGDMLGGASWVGAEEARAQVSQFAILHAPEVGEGHFLDAVSQLPRRRPMQQSIGAADVWLALPGVIDGECDVLDLLLCKRHLPLLANLFHDAANQVDELSNRKLVSAPQIDGGGDGRDCLGIGQTIRLDLCSWLDVHQRYEAIDEVLQRADQYFIRGLDTRIALTCI